MLFAHEKLKKPPQKVAYLWQLGLLFLCSPDCLKQPRTSIPFYKFFYPIVSAKVSDLTWKLLKNSLMVTTEYWAYKSMFVCREGVLSIKAMYFWKKEIYHNSKFKGHFVVCDVVLHNGCFWGFLSKKL